MLKRPADSWPCFFAPSDTTGEKAYEEFYMPDEDLNFTRFSGIGIVKNNSQASSNATANFIQRIENLIQSRQWSKSDLVQEFHQILPEFNYEDKGKYLDSKM
jgi:cell fate regulator YaaT (PSP1 superfamily)